MCFNSWKSNLKTSGIVWFSSTIAKNQAISFLNALSTSGGTLEGKKGDKQINLCAIFIEVIRDGDSRKCSSMGKSSKWWHKVLLPLRLLLLLLCAWAVYTISTGLTSPSTSPATFSRQEVQQFSSWQANQNRSVADASETIFEPIFDRPFPQNLEAKVIHGRQQSRSINNKENSLFKIDFKGQGIMKITRNVTPHGNKRPVDYEFSQKRSSKDHSTRNHVQNGLLEQNFKLSKLINGVLIRGSEHKTDASGNLRKKLNLNLRPASAINLGENETPLHGDRDHERGDVFLSRSDIIKSYIRKYGLNYTLSSKQGYVAQFTARENHKGQLTYVNYHQGKVQASHSSDVRTILLWTSLYNGWNFLPVGPDAFSNCSESHCEITSDRNRLKDSHAVVFHARTMSLTDLPPFRLPHQKWIFFSLEPPPQSYFPGFDFMHGMFNWTMTYRGDSDIVIPYGRVTHTNFTQNITKSGKDWESLWKMKTRPVIWMVSHCHTYSNREFYVHQLQKFIDVDILGGCGTAVCLYNETSKCLEAFSRRYKFFLAFENSICDDYVTEKFFRALKYGIVPVVLGGADYKMSAPPGSYINAADYASPRALADYLHRVSKNSTLYRTYLRWKNDGYVVQDVPSHCSLCQKMHSTDFKEPSTYPNMVNWWVGNSHCKKVDTEIK